MNHRHRMLAIMALVFCAALSSPRLMVADPASALATAQRSTQTVKAGKLVVQRSNITISNSNGLPHLLLDAFPYRQDIAAQGKSFRWESVAGDLVEQVLLVQVPGAQKVKVTVVEFSQRDDYGAPRLDKVTVLCQFTGSFKRGKLKLLRSK